MMAGSNRRFYTVVLPVTVLIPLAFLITRCVTIKQGKILESKINNLNSKTKRIESQNRRVAKLIEELKNEVQKLNTIIENARKNIGENAADFGIQLDKLRSDISTTQGKISEIKFEIDAIQDSIEKYRQEQEEKYEKLKKVIGIDKPIEPSKIPPSKPQHWQKANDEFLKGNYEVARGYFREYIKRYSEDEHADDAQFMIALAYLKEERVAKALGEFQKVIDNYPTSNKMDGVLYYMGEAFFLIKNCHDARTLFKTVINNYPKSPYRKKSIKKIKEILKAPRSVCPNI